MKIKEDKADIQKAIKNFENSIVALGNLKITQVDRNLRNTISELYSIKDSLVKYVEDNYMED